MTVRICRRCDQRKDCDRLGLCAYCRAYTDLPGDWDAERLRREIAVRTEAYDAAHGAFAAETARVEAELAALKGMGADRDRLADTLAWYAATDDADRAADQGRRAREALRAAGRGDAIAAAEAAIRRERDAG